MGGIGAEKENSGTLFRLLPYIEKQMRINMGKEQNGIGVLK